MLSKRTNQRRSVVQCLQKELKKVKKTKFELELVKIADCFLDFHGNYDINLVSFKRKSSQRTILFFQLVRVMSVPKEYKMVIKKDIPNQKISTLVRF